MTRNSGGNKTRTKGRNVRGYAQRWIGSVSQQNGIFSMKHRMPLQTAAVALLLALPMLALANPIPSDPEPFRLPLFLAFFVFLAMEGVILVKLIQRIQPYFPRFVDAWLAVTLMTNILLMISCYRLYHYLAYATHPFRFAGETYKNVVWWQLLVISGEMFVTAVEGVVLYFLVRSPKLVRAAEQAPSFGKCLLYSLMVNLFSFAGGVLATMLFSVDMEFAVLSIGPLFCDPPLIY